MLLIHDDQRLIELKGCFSLTHMNMFKCLHIYWQPIQDVLVLSAICQLNTDNTRPPPGATQFSETHRRNVWSVHKETDKNQTYVLSSGIWTDDIKLFWTSADNYHSAHV